MKSSIENYILQPLVQPHACGGITSSSLARITTLSSSTATATVRAASRTSAIAMNLHTNNASVQLQGISKDSELNVNAPVRTL